MADDPLLSKPPADCTAAELLQLADDSDAKAQIETDAARKMSLRNGTANLRYLASQRQ